jgi:hypothetical protein
MIADHGIAGDFASRTFRLTADGLAVGVVEMPPMDDGERRRLCAAYLALPAYCHIHDPACMHLHYAHLGAGPGGIRVEIEAPAAIARFELHPAARAAGARTEGRFLRFEALPGSPRHFVARIDSLPPLMIAIDPPEEPVPADAVDAGAFLTDRTGLEDQTGCFQRAFAAVNGTGRTLVVPAGTYSVSQLHLRNGRRLGIRLASGCLIRVRAGAPGSNEHRHGLWLEDCEDVALTGRGCIDHQAYEHYALAGNNYQHGMVDYYTANELCPWTTQSPLFVTGSRRIRIEGVVIRNGRNFNINCRGCDDLAIRGVKVFTPAACTPEYADGINTGSCRGVLVEDCLVASNDDTFAAGHYLATYDRRPAGEHVVRRVLGWTLRGSGSRLGFYASFGQGDFTFEDCCFLAMTHSTLLVHALRPGASGEPSRYGAIRVVDCTFDVRSVQFLLSVEKAAIGSLSLAGVAFSGRPPPGAAFVVEGDPASPIGSLSLRSVRCDGSPVTSLAQLNPRIDGVARITVD